jgi:hypothetical protein
MSRGGQLSAKDFAGLLGGRPGWRLEPSPTPGAGSLWCFVVNGKIEFSVSVDRGAIHLYVMETDREVVFPDADAMMAWLRSNRAEAAREHAARPTLKDHEPEDVDLTIGHGGQLSAKDLVQLLGGRPGWRLEPSSTPGAGSQWCFVVNGKIEFSVSVDRGAIRLYVMETDRDVVFPDADAMMAWLRSNRAEAAREPVAAPTLKQRRKRFTDWG